MPSWRHEQRHRQSRELPIVDGQLIRPLHYRASNIMRFAGAPLFFVFGIWALLGACALLLNSSEQFRLIMACIFTALVTLFVALDTWICSVVLTEEEIISRGWRGVRRVKWDALQDMIGAGDNEYLMVRLYTRPFRKGVRSHMIIHGMFQNSREMLDVIVSKIGAGKSERDQ